MIKMKKKKGQTPVISYLLVLGVLLSTVSVAYLWGVPLLKKGSVNSKISDAEQTMLQINNVLENVISNGGEGSITFVSYGRVKISGKDNSVYYILRSEKTPYATNVWIPLTTDNTFGVNGTEEANSKAILGINTPSLVMVRTEPIGNGEYLIIFRLALRNLIDQQGNIYKYELIPQGTTSVETGQHKIIFRKGDVKKSIDNGGVVVYTIPIYATIS